MSNALPGENIPIWGSYLRALRAAPILVKSLTSSAAMATAEYISQKSAGIEDKKRMNTFIMWGLFLGIPNHFWQQIIATYGPDPLKSIWNFLAILAIDHICWKVPILYIFVTYVTYRQSGKNATIADAWEHSKKINPSMQKASVVVWPTAQVLNFLIVPLPLRTLYMNVTLLFWTLYLAFKTRGTRNKKLNDKKKQK
jgi:hypothetical protein